MTTQVLATPSWLIFLRGAQILLSVIVLGISAYGVYWVAFNAWGFAIFTSLATLILVLYGVLSARLASLQKLYNYWAVLALDIFAVIFWLSAMGALAALRAIFVIPTTINGCGHSGDIGGGWCYKRELTKRQSYVATHGYLNLISISAGFSAINFILFVITLVFTGIAVHRARTGGAAAAQTHEESKVESHGLDTVEPPPPASYGQQPTQVHYQQPPPPANYPHA